MSEQDTMNDAEESCTCDTGFTCMARHLTERGRLQMQRGRAASSTSVEINTPAVRYAISNVLHDMLGEVVPSDRIVEVAAGIFVVMDLASAGRDVSTMSVEVEIKADGVAR